MAKDFAVLADRKGGSPWWISNGNEVMGGETCSGAVGVHAEKG